MKKHLGKKAGEVGTCDACLEIVLHVSFDYYTSVEPHCNESQAIGGLLLLAIYEIKISSFKGPKIISIIG